MLYCQMKWLIFVYNANNETAAQTDDVLHDRFVRICAFRMVNLRNERRLPQRLYGFACRFQ